MCIGVGLSMWEIVFESSLVKCVGVLYNTHGYYYCFNFCYSEMPNSSQK